MMLKEDKYLTIESAARRLVVSKRHLERMLTQLKQVGAIKRVGPDKGGYWMLNEDSENFAHVGENVRENVGENVGESSKVRALLMMLKEDKYLTIESAAKRLVVSRRHIERLLAQLKAKGQIKRVGPARGGYWDVVDKER